MISVYLLLDYLISPLTGWGWRVKLLDISFRYHAEKMRILNTLPNGVRMAQYFCGSYFLNITKWEKWTFLVTFWAWVPFIKKQQVRHDKKYSLLLQKTSSPIIMIILLKGIRVLTQTPLFFLFLSRNPFLVIKIITNFAT